MSCPAHFSLFFQQNFLRKIQEIELQLPVNYNMSYTFQKLDSSAMLARTKKASVALFSTLLLEVTERKLH